MEPCERYIGLLSARLDGELTAQEARELEAHLALCPECRALAEELEAIHAAFPELEEAPAPQGFAQGVMDRIRGEETPKVIPLFRRPQFKALAGLAACAVLCVGLYQAGIPKPALGNQESAAMARSVEEETADSIVEPTEAAGYAVEDPGDGTRDAVGGAVTPPQEPGAVYDDTHVQFTAVTAGQEALEQKDDDPAHYAFSNDQYLRVSWREELEAPAAQILGSPDSLADFLARFPEDDLSALTDAYGGDYFQTGRLLAVVVTEGSGSIRHTLAPQGLLRDRVTVLRQIPEAGTCDMAAWLILAEVDALFEDGHTLTVVWEEG